MSIIRMDEMDRIVQIYERQAQECVHAVSRCYEEVVDMARRTTFAPLVDYGNQIYRFYTGDLRDHLMREYRNWYDGSYSFHALMAAINAGNDAITEAKRRMDDMQNSLEGLFRLSQSEVHLDTSVPKIGDQEFEEYGTYLENCKKSIESATNDAESAVRSMEGDNDVVKLIGDIVKTTGVSLAKSVEEMTKQVELGHVSFGGQTQKTVGAVTGQGKAANAHIPWGKGTFL